MFIVTEYAALNGDAVDDLYVCDYALQPCQQFFSHTGMMFCLPGLNQY